MFKVGMYYSSKDSKKKIEERVGDLMKPPLLCYALFAKFKYLSIEGENIIPMISEY
jgi:hypothetical protein